MPTPFQTEAKRLYNQQPDGPWHVVQSRQLSLLSPVFRVVNIKGDVIATTPDERVAKLIANLPDLVDDDLNVRFEDEG